MSVDSLLKKEGIEIIKKLNQKEINVIAKDIAIKLCLAFPEHNLNRNKLFDEFSTVNMYTAKMPKDYSGAKYISEDNSIYFNSDLDFADIPSVAMHECIHFIQNVNSPEKMGLCDFSSGLAINEAAVQLMASEANMEQLSEVKYFDIAINTISPNYYPLECALLNQITYFTGTYPLYHSILFGNNLFKNTFITKFNKKSYNYLIRNLDKLLSFESELNTLALELVYADSPRKIKSLNKFIEIQKKEISNLFYKIQNYIIKTCFTCEFNSIRNNTDLYEFKQMLYNYKNIIGSNDSYTFYNDFYCKTMEALEIKKAQVQKFGEINLFAEECKSLTIVGSTKSTFNFFHTFISKLKKLFILNKEKIKNEI